VRVNRQYLAAIRVAVTVQVADRMQRIPAANVVPAHRNRHDRNPLGMLHHCIVDRNRRRSSKGVRIRMNARPSNRAGRIASCVAVNIVGACAATSSSKKMSARNRKMPPFQARSPDASISSARSRIGFSTKRETRWTPSVRRSPTLIQPSQFQAHRAKCRKLSASLSRPAASPPR
jgi:hypothetical protein